MSDTPVRPGPPNPARATREPRAPSASASGQRIGPELSELATAPERRLGSAMQPAPRRRRAARPVQRETPSLPQLAAGVLVVILVVASLWGSRGLHDPVAGFGLVSASGMVRPAGELSEIGTGQAAPDFRLLTVDDQVLELADLRGAPVVLLFWNTWCLDCQPMLPVMQQAAADWGDRVAVVGVVPQERAGRVRDAAAIQGLTFTQGLDDTGDVTFAYGATVGPVTVVLNADGVVMAVLHGPQTAEELAAAVDPLLP